MIDNMHVKLASSAPAFEGIYEGFEIEITSSASTVDDWYVMFSLSGFIRAMQYNGFVSLYTS